MNYDHGAGLYSLTNATDREPPFNGRSRDQQQ
jgi:hypothetical protein